MQQLSLFDFEEEQPQKNKRKNTAKKDKAEKSTTDYLFETVENNLSEKPEEIVQKIDADFSTDFLVEELEKRVDTSEEEKIAVELTVASKSSVQKRGRKSFKEIDSEIYLIEVPSDEELLQKQYYPISEVAKWFRVNTSLLRFWENQFKILKPKKNKKGDRFFRPEDVKNLKIIYYLLRQKKLTIEGANKHLKAHRQQTEENLQLIKTLNRFKSFLLELKTNAE